MTGAMIGDLFLYSAFFHYLFQLFAHRPIVDFSENQLVFRQVLVPFDYLQGNIQQLHLERDICLVPFRQYPFLTVHLIKEINWPEHTLLVDVKRGESALIPIGDTRLRAGDFLYVLTDDTLAKDLRKMAEGE